MKKEETEPEPAPVRLSLEAAKKKMAFNAQVSHFILTFLGIWPITEKTPLILKLTTPIRWLMCYLFILFLHIPCALHTFIDETIQRKKIKMFGPMIYHWIAMTKFTFLLLRREKIRQCLEQMLEDWSYCSSVADQEIMIKCAKVSRLIAAVATTFTFGSTFFFRFVIPLSMGSRVVNNITIRPLGNPVYRPLIPAINSPEYEIVYAMQTISSIMICSTTVGAGSLATVFVLHACGQLQIVMHRLNNLVDKGEDDVSGMETAVSKRIKEVFELHLRALSFIDRVETIMNELCLAEFTGSMVNICLMVYCTVTALELSETVSQIATYLILVISFTFNIFTFCYIGEMLTQEGLKVGYVAYQIDWYKLPSKDARGLVLLLSMTKQPGSITAGKMAELSYASFSGVLKTSMGYFNLLHQMANAEQQ